MKRQEAIRALRRFHEEAIKAGKGLPAPYIVCVETRENTYADGTAYGFSARLWNDQANGPVGNDHRGNFYAFWSDEKNSEQMTAVLEAFKAEVEQLKRNLKIMAA